MALLVGCQVCDVHLSCAKDMCVKTYTYDKTIGKKEFSDDKFEISYFSGVVCHCDVVWIQKSAEFRCDCRRLNVKCESLDLNIAILWSVDDKEAAVGVVDAVRIRMEIYCGSFKVGKYEILPEQSISNNGTMILFHKLAIVTVEASQEENFIITSESQKNNKRKIYH